MTENEPVKDELGEFAQLAGVLRAADLSGESRVRHSLKNRLLGKAAPEARGFSLRAWMLPAAGAALAALVLMLAMPHKRAENPASGASYATPADAYDACGRQGLKDYLAGPAF